LNTNPFQNHQPRFTNNNLWSLFFFTIDVAVLPSSL
jgi:hypothetical protein